MSIKVGIIEDNHLILKNVSKYLSFDSEIEMVIKAGAVSEFIHSYDQMQPSSIDILLLDIGLPGISGLEALPLLLEKIPSIDIIMLTTYEEEDVILKALCSGAASYLSKRSSLQEILDAIKIVAKGGAYMSPIIAKEVINHLVGGKKVKPSILTDRQNQILELLSTGESYASIATQLNISIETVRTHIKKMYKTLHVSNKTEAISMYLKGEIR